jgi:putative aldouronate transport system permease protein
MKNNYARENIKSKVNKKRFAGFKLFLLAAPFLILVFIFCYFPLFGWMYAFYDYKPPIPLSQSQFVGLFWFKFMFSSSVKVKQLIQVLENTFAISGLGILTSWIPLVFAMFLAEIKMPWFKKSVQTLTTLPNFISWILIYSMAFCLFSYTGVFNKLLMTFHIISTPISFLTQDSHTWLAMSLWGLWKGLGWGSILYLAAIAGVDQVLYEAAAIDGASHFKQMWHITLPALMPTYFVLLLLSVANFLNNGMDQYYIFQNSFNETHIQVLDLYVYNIGMLSGSYSLATAIGIFKSVISVTLLFVVNKLSFLVRGETII